MIIKNATLDVLKASFDYLSTKETKAWFQISKNLKLINVAFDELQADKKVIIEKFATKGDDGEYILKSKMIDFGKNRKKADAAWEDALAIELDLKLLQIQAEDIKEISLSTEMMNPLMDLDILV